MSNQLLNVYEFIDKNRDRFVGDLQDFLKQPSVSAEKFGIEECAEMLLSYMRQIGARGNLVRVGSGEYPIVFAELPPKEETSKRTVLVYAVHYDVQPVERAELWVSPPFDARIIGDRVVARGAADLKSPIMAFIKAVESIMSVTDDLPVNLMFISEGDEEIGSPTLPHFIEANKNTLKKADTMYVTGTFPGEGEHLCVRLGYKGLLYMELEVKLRNKDVHGMFSPIVENPTWRLIEALNSIRNTDGEVTIETFYDTIVPPSPEDIQHLKKIAETIDEEEYKVQLGNPRKFKKDLHGFDLFKELFFGSTLNIDGIISGYTGQGMKTVNPACAKAKVDIRLVPNMKPDEIEYKVREHLKKHRFEDVQLTTVAKYPPVKTPSDNEIVRAVISAAKKMGADPIVYPIEAGSAPAYLFNQPPLNLPICNPQTIETMSRMHVPDEYITLEEYINSIKFHATVIFEYARISAEKLE